METLLEETDLNALARAFAFTTSEVHGFLIYEHDSSQDDEDSLKDQRKLRGALKEWKPAYGSEDKLLHWIRHNREPSRGRTGVRILYHIFFTEMATRRYQRARLPAAQVE